MFLRYFSFSSKCTRLQERVIPIRSTFEWRLLPGKKPAFALNGHVASANMFLRILAMFSVYEKSSRTTCFFRFTIYIAGHNKLQERSVNMRHFSAYLGKGPVRRPPPYKRQKLLSFAAADAFSDLVWPAALWWLATGTSKLYSGALYFSNGQVVTAIGTGYAPDPKEPAKLLVKFDGTFEIHSSHSRKNHVLTKESH